MTATRLLLLVAGLMGATGVVFAALASHAYAGTSPSVAATRLSLHPPAVNAVPAVVAAAPGIKTYADLPVITSPML